MIVYTLEQRWEILRQIDLQKKTSFQMKLILLICKQAKLSHRKPTRIHLKVDVLKTSHCLVLILVQRYNWAIFLRKWARRHRYSQWRSLSDHVEWIFVHQNCCTRGTENPHAYIAKPTLPKRVTVWCGFWSRGIIEPFFFENEQGEAVTVNGNRYRAILNEFLFTK